MKHELVNGTIDNEPNGIIARCTCGWTSGYRISGLVASLAFRDHKEEAERSQREAMAR